MESAQGIRAPHKLRAIALTASSEQTAPDSIANSAKGTVAGRMACDSRSEAYLIQLCDVHMLTCAQSAPLQSAALIHAA